MFISTCTTNSHDKLISDEDLEVSEIYNDTEIEPTTNKTCKVAVWTFQNFATGLSIVRTGSKPVWFPSKKGSQNKALHIAASGSNAEIVAFFGSKENLIAYLQKLSDNTLYKLLQSHPFSDQHILHEALKGRFPRFVTFCIRQAITTISKKYNEECKIDNQSYWPKKGDRPKTAPPVGLSIIKNDDDQAFQVLKNFTPMAEEICALDLNLLPIIHPFILPCFFQRLAQFFPHVESITLSILPDEIRCDHTIAQALSHFTKLKKLTVSCDKNFLPDFFESLPQTIMELKLAGEEVSDQIVDLIFHRLPHLQELSLFYCSITGLWLFQPFAELKKLTLSNCSQLDDTLLEIGLGKMAQLQELSLISSNEIKGEFLKGVPLTLSKLVIIDCPNLDEVRFVALKQRIHLSELRISGDKVTGLFLRCGLPPSIMTINCSDSPHFKGRYLSFLERLANLKELNLSNTSISGAFLEKIPTSLLSLKCSGCRNLQEKALESFLSKATQLKELDLSQTRITGQCLRAIPPSLLSFSCKDCRKLNEENLIVWLNSAKQLKKLEVSHTAVKGKFLHFAPPSITSLNCAQCYLFQPLNFQIGLKRLVNLGWLNISFCNNTISLDCLEHLPNTLGKIICNGYPKNDLQQVVEKAKKILPNLTFEQDVDEELLFFDDSDGECALTEAMQQLAIKIHHPNSEPEKKTKANR